MTNQQSPPINEDRLITLLCDLIDIYSPSGKEVDVLIFLEKYLRRRGLPIHRVVVDEKRFNIIVAENSEESNLLFVGHCDTVPAWDLDSFRSSEAEGIVYGLGAADMKAGCAAMIEAFCTYYETHGTVGSAALALVVGEEETGDGAEALAAAHSSPWAIVGEPTELTTNPEHFGYIEIELSTAGKRAHAAMVQRNHNAVLTMLRKLMEFSTFMENSFPGAIYNIRDVHSADAGFAVPDRCSAAIDLHIPPDSPVGKIVVAIEDFFMEKGTDNDQPVSITFQTVHHGYALPADSHLPSLIETAHKQTHFPYKMGAFKSHSDANVLWAAGIKPVVYGPGSLSVAHTADECVKNQEVIDAARLYLQLLEGSNSG